MNPNDDRIIPFPGARPDAGDDRLDARLDALLARRPLEVGPGFAAAVRARIEAEDRLPAGALLDAADAADLALDRLFASGRLEVSEGFSGRVLAASRRASGRSAWAGAWRAVGSLAAVVALSAILFFQSGTGTDPRVGGEPTTAEVALAAHGDRGVAVAPGTEAVPVLETNAVEFLALEDDLDALAALLDSETLEVLALLSEG